MLAQLPAVLLFAASFFPSTSGHQSPWMPSMFGGMKYDSGDPAVPLGPNLKYDAWWFRGPAVRAAQPNSSVVSLLPAGGQLTLEIACNKEWTSFGGRPTNNVACPGNYGAYHTGEPLFGPLDYNILSGCAIAIADVENVADVTMDNLAVISVQRECVWKKDTVFKIPAAMPPCTGKHCVCAWLWQPQNGTANFYMTGFNCKVTGSPAGARPIAPPSDPVFCGTNRAACTVGSKRPIYAYNNPTNVGGAGGNLDRPGYHPNGPQNDIFVGSNGLPTVVKPSTSTRIATSTSKPATATTKASATNVEPSSRTTTSAAATTTAAKPKGLLGLGGLFGLLKRRDVVGAFVPAETGTYERLQNLASVEA